MFNKVTFHLKNIQISITHEIIVNVFLIKRVIPEKLSDYKNKK